MVLRGILKIISQLSLHTRLSRQVPSNIRWILSSKNVWISNFWSSCEEKKKKTWRRSLAVFSHNLLCRKRFNCKLIYCETGNESYTTTQNSWSDENRRGNAVKACKQTFSCLVTPEMAFTTVISRWSEQQNNSTDDVFCSHTVKSHLQA